MSRDFAEPPRRSGGTSTPPTVARIAGSMWVIFGALVLLNLVLFLLMSYALAAEEGEQAEAKDVAFAVKLASGEVLEGSINLLCGPGLVIAGILALIGRAEYKAWRNARRAQHGI